MKQRVTIATFAGDASWIVKQLHAKWKRRSDPTQIDLFCSFTRNHGDTLPIIYFAEWIDSWLMGDALPGPSKREGKEYQLSVFDRVSALDWAGRCGNQFEEETWFAARLKEAVAVREVVIADRSIVVMRKVLGASTSDDEVRDSLGRVPGWLEQFTAPANPR
jgi:hypothetical protein